MIKVSTRKIINSVFAVAVMLLPFFTVAAHASICDKLLRGLSPVEARFVQGQMPNLEDSIERAAFLGFIQRTYAHPSAAFSETMRREIHEGVIRKTSIQPIQILSQLLLQYPELAQKRFLPNIEVDAHFTHEVTPTIIGIRSIYRNARELYSRLLNPIQNRGFWERFLGSEDASPLFVEEYLRPKVGLSDPGKILFSYLKTLRADRLRAGIEVTEISRIMAGLVWTRGSGSKLLESLFASNDGYYQMEGFKILLAEREKFSQSLGFRNYTQLLAYLRVRKPPGIPEDSQFPRLENAQRIPIHSQFVVRHLSAAESVFRGCLGGDCSTGAYFEKALDPNYHYFTLGFPHTDRPFLGQVTVVLGTADGNRLIAYVDKIQGVPIELIPSTLEAIRQSVASVNYELAVPTQLGWHSGISNSDEVVVFIENKLTSYTLQSKVIYGFKPHPQKYDFFPGCTTADLGNPVKPLLPLDLSNGLSSSFTIIQD